jgi:hypothetical protein
MAEDLIANSPSRLTAWNRRIFFSQWRNDKKEEITTLRRTLSLPEMLDILEGYGRLLSDQIDTIIVRPFLTDFLRFDFKHYIVAKNCGR